MPTYYQCIYIDSQWQESEINSMIDFAGGIFYTFYQVAPLHRNIWLGAGLDGRPGGSLWPLCDVLFNVVKKWKVNRAKECQIYLFLSKQGTIFHQTIAEKTTKGVIFQLKQEFIQPLVSYKDLYIHVLRPLLLLVGNRDFSIDDVHILYTSVLPMAHSSFQTLPLLCTSSTCVGSIAYRHRKNFCSTRHSQKQLKEL